MKDKNFIDIFSFEGMKNAHEDRKMTKFFRWAVPILIIEVLALIAIAVFFFVLPKNYCYASINMKGAVIYINNEKVERVRLDSPKKSVKYYYYGVDLSVKLPEGEDYNVSFEVKCDKYKVFAATSAPKQDNVHYTTITGGEKTQLLSGITVVSDELIKDFDVNIKINVEKITQN